MIGLIDSKNFSFMRWNMSANKVQKNSWLKSLYELITSLIIIVPIAFLIRTFGYGLYQVPTGSMETTMLVGERFFADKLTINFYGINRGDIISLNDPTFKYSDNKFIKTWQKYVYGPSNWTKRVIAVPGDEIKGDIEDGKPVVYLKKSGETEFSKLNEPYVNKYPLIFLYNPNDPEARDGFAYRTYDPNFSLENQPFYHMTKSSIEIAQRVALMTDLSTIQYPNTPFIGSEKNYDIFQKKLEADEYWLMGDNRLNSKDSRVLGAFKSKEIYIHGKIVFRIWSLDSYSSWWIIDLIKHPIDFWKKVRWSRCLQKVS